MNMNNTNFSWRTLSYNWNPETYRRLHRIYVEARWVFVLININLTFSLYFFFKGFDKPGLLMNNIVPLSDHGLYNYTDANGGKEQSKTKALLTPVFGIQFGGHWTPFIKDFFVINENVNQVYYGDDWILIYMVHMVCVVYWDYIEWKKYSNFKFCCRISDQCTKALSSCTRTHITIFSVIWLIKRRGNAKGFHTS